MDNLTRVLNLDKEHTEILKSRLKQYKLLEPDVLITSTRYRSHEIIPFFTTTDDGTLTFCNDVAGLFEILNIEYVHTEWRLFMDASKSGLKGALINKGKILPTIPIAYSRTLKETYETMKLVLEKIKYEQFEWMICGDFKIINILTGLQSGYTKYMCFLCLWDSRDSTNHYKANYVWPRRQQHILGDKNVRHQTFVEKEKVLLPPLHIKLGLIKNFLNCLSHDSDAYKHLKTIFPDISDAKIKAGNSIFYFSKAILI